MQNTFAIETEADYRRREWERAARAEALAAQARPAGRRWSWPAWPFEGRGALRSLIAPRLSLAAILPTRCRLATC